MDKSLKRGERLYQDRRVKAKWRRRVIACWYLPYLDGNYQKRERWLQATVVRRAHHAKCPCRLCKRERYDRTENKKFDID